jgi:hypothetical protein
MTQTLQDATEALQQGNKNLAMGILAAVVKSEPSNETAWLMLASVLDDKDKKQHCLGRVLAINPRNETAQRGLAALQQLAQAPPRAVSQPLQPVETSVDALQRVRQIDNQSEKKCPYCAEAIKFEAVVCRFCGRDLRTGQPSQQVILPSPQPVQVQLPPELLWQPGVAAVQKAATEKKKYPIIGFVGMVLMACSCAWSSVVYLGDSMYGQGRVYDYLCPGHEVIAGISFVVGMIMLTYALFTGHIKVFG